MTRRMKSCLVVAGGMVAVFFSPTATWPQNQGSVSKQAAGAGEGKQPARSAPSQAPTNRSNAASAPTKPTADHAEELPPSPAEIAAWISDLDSREYRVRERATRQLLAAGDAALDPLLAAANGDHPEPADRAVWILQRQAQNVDPDTAETALKRLVQLRDRPKLAAQAESELARIAVVACQRRLTSLGAECSLNIETIATLNPAPVFRVRLGANWRGTSEDLRPLAELNSQQYIALEGPAIDDAVVRLFEARPALASMQLLNTKVSVPAIDALKARHPNAAVQLRNRALMGVGCLIHAAGAKIDRVEPGQAADKAGLAEGVVITAINGQQVPDFDRLTAHVAQYEPGEKMTVEVLRGEERRVFEVTLGSWAEFEQQRGIR
jgi:hypothetical protein